MSNINDLAITHDKSSVSLIARPVEEPLATPAGFAMAEELTDLYLTIDGLALTNGKKIFQFIGTNENEGTSTVVRELAKLAAYEFDRTVLLLDADFMNPSQHRLFSIETKNSWFATLSNDRLFDQALNSIENQSLFLGALVSNPISILHAFNSGTICRLFARLRQLFDLILIDCAPISSSPNSLAISGKSDGVVFVLEADKTRLPVAARAKDIITDHRGEIIGIVLNKRRYPIPQFIYDRL